MCKYLFESLRYNRCLIKLDKVEEKYLYESLKQSIEEKNIKLDSVSNNEYLTKGNNINKIDILFKKIEKNND